MNSFIFALSAVSPIIIMVAIGYFLKKLGAVTKDFTKTANKLVFRVFLPAMLFLNVYNIEDIGRIKLGFAAYAICSLLIIFFCALMFICAFTKSNSGRGVLLQASFRSNYALIGIPLAESLFGDEGAAVATLLSAFIIPVFNMLAVISLSVFRCDGKKPSVKNILLSIVKNPLIQSIILGVLALCIRKAFIQSNTAFRLSDIKPLFSVLKYLSAPATPLALIALGAGFEFSAIASLKREIVFGVFMRCLAVPALGLSVAYIFFSKSFGGAHFAALLSMFATPVAVSSVPMAQEMGGDTTLAGQLVVWTTLVSAVSVFLSAFLLSLAGVF